LQGEIDFLWAPTIRQVVAFPDSVISKPIFGTSYCWYFCFIVDQSSKRENLSSFGILIYYPLMVDLKEFDSEVCVIVIRLNCFIEALVSEGDSNVKIILGHIELGLIKIKVSFYFC
jgi:hypothetical protein